MKYSKIIIQLLAVLLLVSVAVFLQLAKRNRQLQEEVNRQVGNAEALSYTLRYDRLGDSLSVAQNKALRVRCDELKRQHLADVKLMERLKVRVKDVESVHAVASVTMDTVRIIPMADSVYTYADRWLRLRIDIGAKECQYNVHDSLTTIVSRTYKHKFLWWRWGTKGYQVQIVSHNPHSRISYSRFLQVEK